MREANALSRDLREAHQSLQACFDELEKILALPALDPGALTSVRLKLAGFRLTRGPLIARVSDLLSGSLSATEEAMLEQLHASHYALLQSATKHTAKWTLEAISKNWSAYRDDTRELVRKWSAKAEREQRLVYPLVKRCAGLR
jgi:hypothetical protein